MNIRRRKVKSWIQNIYYNINKMRDIFTYGLITSSDIDKNKYNKLINMLDNISIIIEDILFDLDNK